METPAFGGRSRFTLVHTTRTWRSEVREGRWGVKALWFGHGLYLLQAFMD